MESVVRYRAWIVMGVVLLVAVLGGSLAAGTKSGSGRGGGGVPAVRFGSHVAPPGSSSQLSYTNGWVASSDRQSVGVYAGAQAAHRDNGLFVILRRSGDRLKRANVVVRGSGTVTLLRPASPANAQAALTETLHFVTANGATGTLDLSSDSVSLSG